MAPHPKRRYSSKTEGVREQGAEENIWTEENLSDGRLKKTTQ
jgi:hypothetical protein